MCEKHTLSRTHKQTMLFNRCFRVPLVLNVTPTHIKTQRVYKCRKLHGAKAPCNFKKVQEPFFPAFTIQMSCTNCIGVNLALNCMSNENNYNIKHLNSFWRRIFQPIAEITGFLLSPFPALAILDLGIDNFPCISILSLLTYYLLLEHY